MSFNLPPGLWIFYEAKVKEKYSRYSQYWLYTSVCVIYGAEDEEDVERYQIAPALEIKSPSGVPLIPLFLKNTHTQTQILSTVRYTHSLSLSHAQAHLFFRQKQPTQQICLKVNLAYYYYLSSIPAEQSQIPSPHSTFSQRETKSQLSSILPSLLLVRSVKISAPYLFDLSTFCAHKDQRVVLVDIGND